MNPPPATTRTLALVVASVLLASAQSLVASAQTGWQWPWENNAPARPAPPQPPAPVYRPGQQPPPGAQLPPTVTGRNAVCQQLEQRLAQESQRGTQTRDVLPKLQEDIRAIERQIAPAQRRLDDECYEYFLFSKTLKRSRVCVDLSGQVEAGRRRMSELDVQRQQLVGTGGRSYQDEIIRELARNNCGATYQQEANRRGNSPFGSVWQDEDGGAGTGGQFNNLPFATYRTMCVRLCDGYAFPISFSTLPTYFERDEKLCEQRCAAPTELYYYQNPGGAQEQMVSYRSRQPITALKTANRFRKEYVQGCSCKPAEYVASAVTPDRRTDAQPSPPQPQKR